MVDKKDWRHSVKTMTSFLLVVLIALFASRYINTWLGERALENTGLEHLSMEEALNLAQSTDKPIVAKFAAIWCGACRRLDTEVFVDETLKSVLRTDVHYVRFEYEEPEHRRWFDQYGIQGFPQFLLIDKNAKVLGRLRTPQTAAEFVNLLRTL